MAAAVTAAARSSMPPGATTMALASTSDLPSRIAGWMPRRRGMARQSTTHRGTAVAPRCSSMLPRRRRCHRWRSRRLPVQRPRCRGETRRRCVDNESRQRRCRATRTRGRELPMPTPRRPFRMCAIAAPLAEELQRRTTKTGTASWTNATTARPSPTPIRPTSSKSTPEEPRTGLAMLAIPDRRQRESRCLFDALTSGIGSDWTRLTGTWTSSADTFSETALGTGQELSRSLASSIGDYMVETRVTFNVVTAAAERELALPDGWLAQRMGVRDQRRHERSTIPAASDRRSRRNQHSFQCSGAAASGRQLLPPWNGQPRQQHLLHVVDRPARQPHGSHTPTGITGFRTNEAAATFDYMLIYRLGGTIP